MANHLVSFSQPPIPSGDLPLLEGESEDIRRDATELLGEEWFTEPNANFGWESPEAVVREGRAFLVRNSLRAIKYIGAA